MVGDGGMGRWPDLPEPRDLDLGGRRLSYRDFGSGRPVLALHGLFSEGRAFARLAAALAPRWRVIAPDQRGHGWSDPAPPYTREGFLGDIVALLDHLGIARLPIVGHSLGGANAYQLAARRPDRVSALVVADVGAVIEADLSFARAWPRRAATREQFLDGLGFLGPYLVDGVCEHPDGWGLSCRVEEALDTQQLLNGDHWADWLAVCCPTLLIAGSDSFVLSADHAAEMVAKLPRASLTVLPGGHFVHDDDEAGFAAAVRSFLDATAA
ncbi:alpha/beta hydrolase [Catellatospora sp. NPDC049609]|uniref:alpha/beta fold hydrolase n=1 Tax=Catellatospora sp. NPDC049609 TaxID=3155505 RepID=UPI00343991D3